MITCSFIRRVLLSLMISGSCAGPLQAAEFRVGLSEMEITPPPGYRMYGSLYENFSTGAHDPLMVKAMVLEQGREKCALVIADLCFISRKLSEPVRELASRETGIPASNIVIMATHTHGGPEYDGVQRDLRHQRALKNGGSDSHEPFDYLARLRQQFTQSVLNAQHSLRPVKGSLLKTELPGMAHNRRFHMKDGSVRFIPAKRDPNIIAPAGPVDPELLSLVWRDAANDTPLGSLTSFAMHVAAFYDQGKWGADYPGVLASRYRELFGSGFISLFGQGTAGNINHIDFFSDQPQPGDKEPPRIGNALADKLLGHLEDFSPGGDLRLEVSSKTVLAPLVEITPEAIARSRDILERTDIPGGIDFYVTVEAWKILNTAAFRKRFGEKLPLEINALRLNKDTAVVCLPHEVFVEIGLAIKKASPFRNTFILSMAHDIDFYILNRQGYADGGYEAVTSSLKPGAGEIMVNTALELLGQLSK
jgi:neutral ceramidase